MANPILALVSDEIRLQTTSAVEFHNGCWLALPAQGNAYWGTTPYGTDWSCNADTSAPGIIASWIHFWNETRDEAGGLIHSPST